MKYDNILKREGIEEGKRIRRSFVCDQVKSIDKDKRLIDFTISTDRVDRYGDVVTVSGWDLKEYRKNPIILFGHNSRALPIGRALKVWKDDALHATAEFMSEELNPFAYSVFRMFEEKYLRAVSVGFIPKKWEEIMDDAGHWTGYKFLKQELLEFSAVPIPANPDALVDARSKGIDLEPIRSWAEENLDNWSAELDASFKDLYNVERKDIELIRKKAAGVGTVFKIPLSVQDELLRKNLDAAKKAKKVLDDAVEELEAKQPVLFHFNLAPGLEVGLPSIKLADFEDVEQLLVTVEEIDGVKSHSFENVPNNCTFDPSFFESNDLVKFDPEKGTVTLKSATGDLVYKILGGDIEQNKIIGNLVSIETKAKTIEEKIEEPPVEPKVETPTVEVTLQVKDAEEFEEKQNNTLGELLELKILEKTELSFESELQLFEENLMAFEESLDKCIKTSYPLNTHAIRKMKFLADCMKDIAPKLNLVKDVEKVPVTETVEGLTGENFDKILAERVNSLGPVITSIVERELRKAKGRLD